MRPISSSRASTDSSDSPAALANNFFTLRVYCAIRRGGVTSVGRSLALDTSGPTARVALVVGQRGGAGGRRAERSPTFGYPSAAVPRSALCARLERSASWRRWLAAAGPAASPVCGSVWRCARGSRWPTTCPSTWCRRCRRWRWIWPRQDPAALLVPASMLARGRCTDSCTASTRRRRPSRWRGPRSCGWRPAPCIDRVRAEAERARR